MTPPIADRAPGSQQALQYAAFWKVAAAPRSAGKDIAFVKLFTDVLQL